MGFLDFSVFSGVLGFRIGGVLSDTFSFGRHGLMAERSLENTLLGCFFFAKFSSTQHTTKTLLSQDLFLSSVFRSYRKGSRQIVQRHRFLKFSFLVYLGIYTTRSCHYNYSGHNSRVNSKSTIPSHKNAPITLIR